MSRFKNTPEQIQQLNKNVLFLNFVDCSSHNEPTDSAEAEYFGYTINVSFPNDTDDREINVDYYTTFYIQLFEGSVSEATTGYPTFDQHFNTLTDTVNAINTYIRSRPFKIVWHGGRKFQLLDPNGMDYIGEYVSLANAEQVCAKNFTR